MSAPELRVGIVCDLLEERWPSMDLVADMLLDQLQTSHASEIRAERIRPEFPARFGRHADRLLHRFWNYPRALRRQGRRCGIYHVMDHSYAQLVHDLPAARTVVTCHDLDTFRCVLDPPRDPRSAPFRLMTGRILSGLRKAAWITCDSHATREELLHYGVAAPERTSIVANGVHPACSPEPDASADAEAEKLLGEREERSIDLLHVGSTIPRKRIDVLLEIFAAIARLGLNFGQQFRLIRAGGAFTATQDAMVRQLGIGSSIVVLPYLDRAVLAAIYRRAALVLQPSESEGFGLPLAEALACGTPVVASDLPVLREVGGQSATYCPLASVNIWSQTVMKLLCEREDRPDLWAMRQLAGINRASQFNWKNYASQMLKIYRNLPLA